MFDSLELSSLRDLDSDDACPPPPIDPYIPRHRITKIEENTNVRAGQHKALKADDHQQRHHNRN